jgi:hypothetical protein
VQESENDADASGPQTEADVSEESETDEFAGMTTREARKAARKKEKKEWKQEDKQAVRGCFRKWSPMQNPKIPPLRDMTQLVKHAPTSSS